MLKYSIKVTGVIYNNYNDYYNNKSFTIEGINKYDVLPLHFVFYPEDSSEIQIEYFKAKE